MSIERKVKVCQGSSSPAKMEVISYIHLGYNRSSRCARDLPRGTARGKAPPLFQDSLSSPRSISPVRRAHRILSQKTYRLTDCALRFLYWAL